MAPAETVDMVRICIRMDGQIVTYNSSRFTGVNNTHTASHGLTYPGCERGAHEGDVAPRKTGAEIAAEYEPISYRSLKHKATAADVSTSPQHTCYCKVIAMSWFYMYVHTVNVKRVICKYTSVNYRHTHIRKKI